MTISHADSSDSYFGSFRRARFGVAPRVCHLGGAVDGQPKVRDLDLQVVAGHQDVLRLDVAVDQALRGDGCTTLNCQNRANRIETTKMHEAAVVSRSVGLPPRPAPAGLTAVQHCELPAATASSRPVPRQAL